MKIRIESPRRLALLAAATLLSPSCLITSTRAETGKAGSADERAAALVAHLTREEKLSLVLSGSAGVITGKIPEGALGSLAYLPLPKSLGVPALQYIDSGMGITNLRHLRNDGPSVALPSGLATAATWDPAIARKSGAMLGTEAWRKGFNVLLAGGVNLTRDPRGGRNFEYAGEDPLLAGTIVGNSVAGIQSRHVLSTIKHYVMNDLETGRKTVSANIAPAALRESDMLAFEIAAEVGQPGSVMCSYNRVNEVYACENRYILTDALKHDWHYRGFVMSDWGGTHSTVRAAMAGLDQESDGVELDSRPFFGKPLARAVDEGRVPASRLDDMARRIVRSIVAIGLPDHQPVRQPLDIPSDLAISRQDAEEAIVLLKNGKNVLPLAEKAHVVIIGGHADVGVLSGGGSGQVDAIGGNAVKNGGQATWSGDAMWYPSSPLKHLADLHKGATVDFVSGDDPKKAAQAAAKADVAIVFAYQWSAESADMVDMALPGGQNALIASVARANPHTVVVLETGNPVIMPWASDVAGIVEAWYPGAEGGAAIANILSGTVAPSGHLPVTFPQNAAQLAHPDIAGVKPSEMFGLKYHNVDQEIEYDEGSNVGYRWFDLKHETPLFAFGHGLGYTSFHFSDLRITTTHDTVSASVTVRNTGDRTGVAVPQIYATLPDGGARRLAGWSRLELAPGASRTLTIPLDSRTLAHFDADAGDWSVPAGIFTFHLASSAVEDQETHKAALKGWHLPA